MKRNGVKNLFVKHWWIVLVVVGVAVLMVAFFDIDSGKISLSPTVNKIIPGLKAPGTGEDNSGVKINSGGNQGGIGEENYRVFVTKETFEPDFGGVRRGDFLCKRAAWNAGLGGKWVAWLSSSSLDAKDKIADGIYTRLDGAAVARNKADLLDGTILNPIKIDEHGDLIQVNNPEDKFVWTGTEENGEVSSEGTCDNWKNKGNDVGAVGNLELTGEGWSGGTPGQADSCDNQFHLYCFEVEDNGGIFGNIDSERVPSGGTILDDADEIPRGCIEVWTAEDLDNVRNGLNRCYVQMADIDLSGYDNWEPIGDLDNKRYFTGSYDGQGFEIKNMRIDMETTEGTVAGLFLAVEGGELKNIKMVSPIISIVHSDGGNFDFIIGTVVGGLLEWSVLSDSSVVSGSIYASEIDTVGGVVGTANADGVKITNCDYEGSIVIGGGDANRIGGVVGGTYSHYPGKILSIENCKFNGLIDIIDESVWGVGGIIGSAGDTQIIGSVFSGEIKGLGKEVGGIAGNVWGDLSLVSGSSSSGIISGKNFIGGLIGDTYSTSITDSHATGDVSGNYDVGGLIGETYGEGSVTNSYATGDVNGMENDVGGLIGYSSSGGAVTDSYATGDVNGYSTVGGLIGGSSEGSVTNSYATGSVSGDISAGGLIGGTYGFSSVTNSYATGSVSGNYDVGGFIGKSYPGDSFYDSYWDIETSGQSQGCGTGDCSGIEGKTTVEMKQQNTFVNWDFANVWDIIESRTYPYFDWQLDVMNDSYYKFEDDVTDSADGHDGEIFGDHHWYIDGKIGRALRFGGEDYVSVPDDDGLDLGERFTIAGWIYLNEDGKNQAIISKSSPGGGWAPYTFGVSDSNKLVLTIKPDNSNSNTQWIASDEVLTKWDWHHVAVSFNDGEAKLYIDGDFEGSKDLGVTPWASDADLTIGAGRNAGGIFDGLKGRLDDLRIYRRALDENEIRALIG